MEAIKDKLTPEQMEAIKRKFADKRKQAEDQETVKK
jgi:hypothetical protein